MNKIDTTYLSLMKEIRDNGITKSDRTGTGTKSLFGKYLEYDLDEGFPILTTKKVFFKGVKVELLWFLGNHMKLDEYKDLQLTNIKYLVDNGVGIWNDWCLKDYNDNNVGNELSEEDFVEKIKSDKEFAYRWGSIGKGAYGEQWTNFNGEINQIEYCIDLLKNNPDSRRILLSAWNPSELKNCLLNTCHYGFQFNTYLNDDNTRNLEMSWNQRSVDYFLGYPFNLSSYSLLLHMVGQVVDMKPTRIVSNLGDTHLYLNHLDAVETQLNRSNNHKLPTLWLNPDIRDIHDFTIDDIKLIGYESDATIKAPIAV